MREKIEKLNEEYFRLFWRCENNKKGLSKEHYEKVQEVLSKQYIREYELLDNTEGLKLDKQIAELSLQREKQTTEIYIQQQTAAAEQQIKKDVLIPADLPLRWWQRRARPNYAKQLAAEEAQIDIDKYFEMREDKLAKLQQAETATRIYETLSAGLTMPRSKRKRRVLEEQLHELAQVLCHTLTVTQTQAQLAAALQAADEADPAETFAEPQGADVQEQAEPQGADVRAHPEQKI